MDATIQLPDPLPQRFPQTLEALHRLAVYVISPAQRLVNGEIVLRATPGGFSTYEFDGGPVGVDGSQLVVDGIHRPITSLMEAAEAAGIEPDVGQQEQFDVPAAGDLVGPLEVDEHAARALGLWYAYATELLEQLRADWAEAAADVSPVQIWPEHFDAAIDAGDDSAGRRATYGASPGDRSHPLPYLYVAPWAGRIDDYFADPAFKGASLGYRQLVSSPDPAATGRAFLAEARRRIDGAERRPRN